MQSTISYMMLIIFVVTTFLVLINMLHSLDDIPILRYAKIRESQFKKLFMILILEVVIAMVPISISILKSSLQESSYEDFHIISSNGETEIYYRKPFKYIPSLKVYEKSNSRPLFKVVTQKNDRFIVQVDGYISDFKINYHVIGVQ